MKIKTADLIGPALDWAVGMADPTAPAYQADVLWRRMVAGSWAPSVRYEQGGPIIEQERMNVWCTTLRIGGPDHLWAAGGDADSLAGVYGSGPTPLIAAMRYFVRSKLGDEVDIPEELT